MGRYMGQDPSSGAWMEVVAACLRVTIELCNDDVEYFGAQSPLRGVGFVFVGWRRRKIVTS